MIKEIYYNHANRNITTDKGDVITYETVLKLLNESTNHLGFPSFTMNMSMVRLIQNAGDMEKVEKQYQEEDKHKI